MPANWLFSVTPENSEIVTTRQIWAVDEEATAKRIAVEDRLIFYLIRSKPPSIVGIYQIAGGWRRSDAVTWWDEKEMNGIIYPWQVDLKPIKIGAARITELVPSLSFIQQKHAWPVYVRGTPANFGKPIPEEDYGRILDALKEDVASVETEPRRRTAAPPEPRRLEQPSGKPSLKHNEIRDILKELGQLKGYVAVTEHPMDSMRVDAVWMTVPQAAPNWVFEVQIGGDIYEALTKLKHAYDIWNSRHLYLVTTEDYVDQAEWLLSGAFHQIQRDAKVIHWRKVVELHETLIKASVLEKELEMERSQ